MWTPTIFAFLTMNITSHPDVTCHQVCKKLSSNTDLLFILPPKMKPQALSLTKLLVVDILACTTNHLVLWVPGYHLVCFFNHLSTPKDTNMMLNQLERTIGANCYHRDFVCKLSKQRQRLHVNKRKFKVKMSAIF